MQSTVAGSRLLQDLANAIYIYGHWPVLIVAGVLLYRYRREHYYTLRNACLLTGLLGLFVFASVPRGAAAADRSAADRHGHQRRAPATGRSCHRRS